MSKSRKTGKADHLITMAENAKIVLERRYLARDRDGRICETPEQMFRRVADHIAGAETVFDPGADTRAVSDRFYAMMTEFRFLPNSPTLMNAGRDLGQLAACFVLPVEDSMEGIFDTLKNAAIIHKSGGGTGFSFSRLRPEKSRVGSTGGVASGPVSFMRIFNTATEQVKQGGTRRGANMAVLRVDHPDILAFIRCKSNPSAPGALNNFNISVAVTDDFMAAVQSDREYDLIDPMTGRPSGRVSAAQVYSELVDRAWKTGDPGILFLDEINRGNTLPALGEIEATNPCGEQPLLPMEACNLGSVNLARFVGHDTGKPVLDTDSLGQTVRTAVRFLDNAIEASVYPIPEIEAMVRGNRKIGLGIMGFADMLFMMGIPYDADAALDMAEEVMGFVRAQSHAASGELARERGPFPNFDKSIFKEKGDAPMRNAAVTTIAPTGTLSIIAGCSSGIEPVFALSYTRNVMDNDCLVEVNPVFEQAAKTKGIYDKALMAEIAKKGTIAGNSKVPAALRKIFITAHDIAPQAHVRMQAAFQRHTDNAVSKTVNLPREATREDVRAVYDLAHELKCKGVTIYRDGSHENQVLSLGGTAGTGRENGFLAAGRERPDTLPGFTEKIKTGLGSLYVTVTEYKGRPFEIFATIGKSGKSTTAKTEAIGRLISLALRSGIPVEEVIGQIRGIRGEHAVFQDGGLVLSIPDAIAKVLEKHYLAQNKKNRARGSSLASDLCPECGRPVAFEEGCLTCHACGYTRCG